MVVNGVFDQRLDWGEARTPREQDHRLDRLLAQKEAAVGPLETQDVLFFHAAEDMAGELAAGNQPDMQLQEAIVMRRVGDGKRAALAVLQQELDVLAGEKLQALVGGQFEAQHDHVVGHALDLLHPAGHDLDRDVLRRAHFAAFQHQVGKRLRATEQCQTAGTIGGR